MRSELKARGRYLRPLYIATMAAVFGAGAAGASDTGNFTTDKDGLITFPNVRVVNAPQLATPSTVKAAQPGLKAYIDPATGMLRAATPEELIRESIERQQAMTLQQQTAGPPREFVHPNGAVELVLDESQMMYSVVQKLDNGELVEFCVVGPEQATKIVNLKAPALGALQRKGNRDER